LKTISHVFDFESFQKFFYKCIYCNESWEHIRDNLPAERMEHYRKYMMPKFIMPESCSYNERLNYLNEYSRSKCITEEEFIIKSIIE